MTSEEALLAGLRRGDEETFRRVVTQYHASLVRLARTFVSSTAVAEEVVQDTWIAVIKGVGRFEERSSFKTWMFRILVNQARTRGTREARSVASGSMFDDSTPPMAPHRFQGADSAHPNHWTILPSDWAKLPEESLSSYETINVIAEAIERLPLSQRQVIKLRDVEGLSTDEVCEVLEITEGNQRVLLHRARSRVRSSLEIHLEGVAAS